MIQQSSYTRITLGLDIIRRIEKGPFRGYHELCIVKHLISLCDTITIEPSEALQIECSDPDVPCGPDNACHKAVTFLKEMFEVDSNVHIYIQKRIPVKAGLAGGSANAAAAIQLCNRLWGMNLDTEKMCMVGRKVGMDVPYYFVAPTCIDTEAGGEVKPLDTDISFDLILLIPDFGVSTKEAYRMIDYSLTGADKYKTEMLIKGLSSGNRRLALDALHNDFEQFVFAAYPRLGEMKKHMLEAGCTNVVMSGSGSTLVGFATSREHAESLCKKIPYKTILASSRI